VIDSQAVLIAIGIDWDGRRQVVAVELANRESRSSWRDFLLGLKARGLHGVEFAVADDHAGLRAALREALAEAAYQRCYVHFLRNALDTVCPAADNGRRNAPWGPRVLTLLPLARRVRATDQLATRGALVTAIDAVATLGRSAGF
jgi:hypothetical protein